MFSRGNSLNQLYKHNHPPEYIFNVTVNFRLAFGNRWWLRVHHTKPSTLGWSVVVGLYTKAIDNQPLLLSSRLTVLPIYSIQNTRTHG